MAINKHLIVWLGNGKNKNKKRKANLTGTE